MNHAAITVTLEGEPEPYTARPNAGTLIAMEDFYGPKIESAESALKTGRLEYIAFLVWECQRRDGHPVKPFEQYRKQIIDFHTEDLSAAPLAEGPPPGV